MSDSQAVLYVEDDALMREIATMILEDAGFEVVVAENAAAAFEALDDNADPFCAIVTDIQLGSGPDGWAVARRARELNDALPVVYVSGTSSQEWQSKGVPHSIMLSKPFTSEQMVCVVSSLLMRGSPLKH
jgi:DNA-binding response OmpR family regulator